MSITAVQSSSILTPSTPAATPTKPVAPQTETSTPSGLVKGDSLEIKKGLAPTFKGAGAGALAASGSTIALMAILNKGNPFAGDGALVSVPLAFAAGLGGAVGGAVSANFTDNKGKGTLLGGLAGASIGAATLALMNMGDGPAGMIQAALSGAVVGGLTGAVGGLGGSFVASKK